MDIPLVSPQIGAAKAIEQPGQGDFMSVSTQGPVTGMGSAQLVGMGYMSSSAPADPLMALKAQQGVPPAAPSAF
jgi:hypothetical protein